MWLITTSLRWLKKPLQVVRSSIRGLLIHITLTDTGTALTGAGTVICPAASKIYIVENGTAQVITVKTSSGTGIAVPVGKNMVVFCDGTNVEEGISNIASLSIGGDGATVTGIKDEDDMSSNSATKLATQQSIKAYVDSQVTAQDLDVTDGSTTISIDLDSESLGILGGTGIGSTASGNNVTVAIDATVATLTGSQTLTNKTLTSPDINAPDIDGGAIDDAVIGGTTPAAGSFTTIAASGNVDFNADVDVDGTLETDALTINGVASVPFEAADHSKLDGIEANADVTDATNVTAAGALMDSELTNITAVKALNQGVATTDSPTFAGITTSGTTNTANLTVSGTQGSDGQVLTSTGSGVQWEDAAGGVDGILSSTTTTIIRLSSANKVGIGQNVGNALAQLHVYQASGSGDLFRVQTGAGTHMLMNSSGNLGINTESPSQLLDVNGTVELNNLTVNGAQGSDGQVLTSTGSGVQWENAGGGGRWTQISSTTLTASDNVDFIDFNNFDSSYKEFELRVSGVASPGNRQLSLFLDFGSGVVTSSTYTYKKWYGPNSSTSTGPFYQRDNASAGIPFGFNDSGESFLHGQARFTNKGSLVQTFAIGAQSESSGYGVSPQTGGGFLYASKNSTITGIRVRNQYTGSNYEIVGTFTLYGLAIS
jgi:hypothetical protein